MSRDRSPVRDPRPRPPPAIRRGYEYTGWGPGLDATTKIQIQTPATDVRYFAEVGGGERIEVTSPGRVPSHTDGLGGRAVVTCPDGVRRVMPDTTTVTFDADAFAFVFAFLAWQADMPDKPAKPFEIAVNSGGFQYAVDAIFTNVLDSVTVTVAGGPPFVAKILHVSTTSIPLNGPFEIWVDDLVHAREPVEDTHGNYIDGRRYFQGNADKARRFWNVSTCSNAELAEMRRNDLRERWACAATGRRPPTDPAVCAHPWCTGEVDRTMYCVEAGCELGDDCPLKDKHGACFPHGYPLGMCHPVAWYKPGGAGSA